DPYEDFDYHYRRQNFGEPLHKDYEIYTSDRHNPNEVLRYTPLQMIAAFLGTFLFFYVCSITDSYFDLRNSWQVVCLVMHSFNCLNPNVDYLSFPQKPKQYPQPGVVHYTFEPLE
ncbi:unnamed protein product, partial [Oppiella nova]